MQTRHTKKKVHKERLGVESNTKYYRTTLCDDLVMQYKVSGLPNMLLSRRSRKESDGYVICSSCYSGMQPNMVEKKTPPKHAIVNGFVMGCFPSKIKFTNKDGSKTMKDIKEEDLTDIM